MDAETIKAYKEELRKDLEALERVERMMAAKSDAVAVKNDKQLPLLSPRIVESTQVDEQEVDEYDTEAPSDSLRGTIERIVNGDPATRWTTQKVLTRLKELKYNLRAQKPIYSVGQSLNVLAKKGRIRLARKGAGSAPNVYRAKTQDSPNAHRNEGNADLSSYQ
jgi:hypothetical protein